MTARASFGDRLRRLGRALLWLPLFAGVGVGASLVLARFSPVAQAPSWSLAGNALSLALSFGFATWLVGVRLTKHSWDQLGWHTTGGLARRILGPGRLIGGSASNLDEARKCEAEGAGYVGFGPVYPTGSKADAGPASGLELLREAAQAVSIPVIAIGGIGPANAPDVMRAGAHGIAVISAVCCRPDPAEATRALRRAIEGAGRTVHA